MIIDITGVGLIPGNYGNDCPNAKRTKCSSLGRCRAGACSRRKTFRYDGGGKPPPYNIILALRNFFQKTIDKSPFPQYNAFCTWTISSAG